MQLNPANNTSRGFSLAESCLAMAVAAVFGLAAFATNQRLLVALKSQTETVAATMALQWRMETFRKMALGDIASAGTGSDYVKTNILTLRNPKDGNGNPILDVAGNRVDPFAPLGTLTEIFIITPILGDGSMGTPTILEWDKNHPNGQYISITSYSPLQYASASPNNNIANDASSGMVKVEVLETWSSHGRQRQRQLSTITIGNIAGNPTDS